MCLQNSHLMVLIHNTQSFSAVGWQWLPRFLNGLLVDAHEHFVITFRSVLCLIFRTSILPHLSQVVWMSPCPINFSCQIVGVARDKVQPRVSLLHDVLHHSSTRSNNWNSACECLNCNEAKCFIMTLRRPYKKPSCLHQIEER